MPVVKDAAVIAEKWARVTPGRTPDYLQGIQNPRYSWAASAAAAEPNYKTGVTEAATRGAFSKGVKAAGDAKWQRNSLAKGQTRYAEGVAVGQPDYLAGVAPYIEVIRSTVLPPRFPRGSPQNIQRVAVLNAALRKRKTG